MSGKKFKTFCKIYDYVASVDSELAEILRGVCADVVLGSTRGKPGITFLMPQDKAVRKKLSDLAYSDNVKDANAASDMINAMILRDVFKAPADWMAKKDDIPNSLYPAQHVEIDGVSGKDIIFKSGAKATLDTDFKDASKKGNLAVWKLTGEIPVTTDKPAKLKYAKMARGAKTGGYEVASIESQSERFKIAIAVENTYALHRLAGPAAGQADPFLAHSMSLVNYIMHVRNDTELMYSRVLPLLSFDKIDFYLLVEPHKPSGEHLLDDMLIREWWAQRAQHQCDPAAVMREVQEMLERPGTQTAAVYTGREQILDKLAGLRQHLGSFIDSRPRGCIDEIAKIYAELEQTNALNGLENIFPADLAAYYAAEPGLKMMQDELRYLTYGAFKRLESEPQFDIGRYHDLLNMIGECLYAGSSVDRDAQHKLLNKTSIKYQISPTEKVQEIKIFVYSTMFVFIPLTAAEAADLKQKYTISRPDPSNIVVFNIAKDLYIQHQRLISVPGPNSADLIAALKSLRVETLDPVLREELRRKLV